MENNEEKSGGAVMPSIGGVITSNELQQNKGMPVEVEKVLEGG